jgi:hypothetical protein
MAPGATAVTGVDTFADEPVDLRRPDPKVPARNQDGDVRRGGALEPERAHGIEQHQVRRPEFGVAAPLLDLRPAADHYLDRQVLAVGGVPLLPEKALSGVSRENSRSGPRLRVAIRPRKSAPASLLTSGGNLLAANSSWIVSRLTITGQG